MSRAWLKTGLFELVFFHLTIPHSCCLFCGGVKSEVWNNGKIISMKRGFCTSQSNPIQEWYSTYLPENIAMFSPAFLRSVWLACCSWLARAILLTHSCASRARSAAHFTGGTWWSSRHSLWHCKAFLEKSSGNRDQKLAWAKNLYAWDLQMHVVIIYIPMTI